MLTNLRVALSRIFSLLRPGSEEGNFDEELRSHLDMATEDKIAAGMSPAEAHRRSRLELGNLTQLKEAGREVRSLPWVGASWLDAKLGLRMLRKSWGLTLVAGLAMTVVIAIAAVVFDVVATFNGTALPLVDGDRVVSVQVWNQQTRQSRRVSTLDFERWREEARSLVGIGAFRSVERNLQVTDAVADDRPAQAVAVAEMSAAGFRVAGVEPILGRAFVQSDEALGSDPVVVLGQEVWQQLFDSDPAVLERRVRLDGTEHSVVGIMPEGFGFPLYHRFWTPLRASGEAYSPEGSHENLVVFARLAPDVTLEGAHAELSTLGRLSAPGDDALEERLAVRVLPYARAFAPDFESWMAGAMAFMVALLLIPPCTNIAILVYARTITRYGEFAARYVLGATRTHIVSQLFVEILVLAVGSGVVALLAVRFVAWKLLQNMRDRGGEVPFWMEFGLSAHTVAFVVGLVLLAALIAGAVPALRATGTRMQSGLRSLGGLSRARLGGAWTTLIILQVAFSFALLPTSFEMTWGTLRSAVLGPGFPAESYLTAHLEMSGLDDTGSPKSMDPQVLALFDARRQELVRQLEADPSIVAVTIAAKAPGEEPWYPRIRVDGVSPSGTQLGSVSIGTSRQSRVNQIDPAFLSTFELTPLTGRGFEPADFEPGSNPVLVNRSFVSNVMGEGTNPLGRRIAYSMNREPAKDGDLEPWYEVVGVVPDVQINSDVQTLYHPAPPETSRAVTLILRVRADPTAAAGALREITWKVDPALRVTNLRRLDEIYRQQAVGNYIGAFGLVAGSLSVLLLSAAGLYAMTSFTVNRRRKEIGIRTALGAQPLRLLAGILGPSISQISFGAIGGVGVALLIGHFIPIGEMGGWEVPGVIPAAVALIAAMGSAALVGPARRGLKVQPVDELREG